MSVRELNRTQLRQLKESYYTEIHDSVSQGELSMIEDLVSDDEVFSFYDGTEFVTDDFWN